MNNELFEKLVVETMQDAYKEYISKPSDVPEGFEHVDSFCTGFKMGMSALIVMIRNRGIVQTDIDAKLATDEVINKMKGGN
jgi:hypothetical protein